MKVLRIIGTVCTSLLSAILILSLVLTLTVSMTLISTAHAFNEKTIPDAMTEVLHEEEVREELAQEISLVALSSVSKYIQQTSQDPTKMEKTLEMLETYAPVYMEDILSTPEIQEFVGSVIADYTMAALAMKNYDAISLSDKMIHLVSENGAVIDRKIAQIFSDLNVSDATARQYIASYSKHFDITVPENYSSYSDLLLQTVTHYSENIDRSAKNVIETILPILEFIDFQGLVGLSYQSTASSTPMLSAQIVLLSANANAPESSADELSQNFTFFKNPVMYVIVAALFFVCFCLLALCSGGFRKAFLFTGIATVASGLILLVMSQMSAPLNPIISLFFANTSENSAVLQALYGVWPSVSPLMVIHASVIIAISVVLFIIFVDLTVKRKRTLAAKAVFDEGTSKERTSSRYERYLAMREEQENTTQNTEDQTSSAEN